MDQSELEEHESGPASWLKALAHPFRLQVVGLLASCNHNTRDLQEALQVSGPVLSQHLAILRKTGLIHRKRRGLHLDYSLNPEALRGLADWLEGLRALRLDGHAEERYREGVLESYLSQTMPRSLPRHPLKRALLATYYGRSLEAGRFYPVDELESQLRRDCREWKELLEEMVQQGLIQGNGQYWLRID